MNEPSAKKYTRRAFIEVGAAAAVATQVVPGATTAAGKNGGDALPFDDYARHDGLGLAQLVARAEVSAEELLHAAIQRTEQVNPQINAVVQKLYDFAKQEINRGLPDGPFKGVPFLLKDLGIHLAGTPNTYGSLFFKDSIARDTSAVVDRYRQAGLVIFGKTTAPEFGTSGFCESALYGVTRNPWNLRHSPGGSSGGAGAAVAAGIAPMANGSDIGGSIRCPSSCCGLFGLKPSYGRVPLDPEWSEMNTFHALTRSVRDSAALLDISSAGYTDNSFWRAPPAARPFSEEVSRPPGRLRIALVRAPVSEITVHPEVAEALQDAAKLCESLGHFVEESKLPFSVQQVYAAATGVGTEITRWVGQREKELGRSVRPGELSAGIAEMVQENRKISGEDYARGLEALRQCRRMMAKFQIEYDLILSPTQAILPPKASVQDLGAGDLSMDDTNNALAAFTFLYNVTGQPAMSVPLHWSTTGLPVGVMFAGRFGDEAALFRLAAQLEQARPWFGKRAPL